MTPTRSGEKNISGTGVPSNLSAQSNVDLRVDGPHISSADQGQAAAVEAGAVVGEGVGAVLDVAQLRLHASQLASHLDALRAQLDRRESDLNVRIAESENQLRGARLWLQQRDEEHAARTAALDDRENRLREQESRLGTDSAAVASGLAALERQQQAIATAQRQLASQARAVHHGLERLHRERDEFLSGIRGQHQRATRRFLAVDALAHQLLRGLERRRSSIEAEHERLLAKARLVAREAYRDEVQRATADLQQRERALEDAEALLADAQQQQRLAQEQIEQHRRSHEAECRLEREALARREREIDERWQRQQETLSGRAERLDSRKAALEQARDEVAAMHRESLELRLSCEELWARISEAVPSAALEQSLGSLRQRLTESYAVDRREVEQQRHHLDVLQTRLGEQATRLESEKRDLRIWIEHRQQDLEAQAARLVARERELDQQQRSCEAERREWEEERSAYQAEIRQLLGQLRREPTAA